METYYVIGALLLGVALATAGIQFENAIVLCLGILPPLFALGLIVALRRYRPPQNHIAAIYRWDRFNRFVDANRWSFLGIGERVHLEHNLRVRTAALTLEHVLTADEWTVRIAIRINYTVDLRDAQRPFLYQALNLPEDAWNTIIESHTNEVIRGDIAVDYDLYALAFGEGRRKLKDRLLAALRERLPTMGYTITGALLTDLQPEGAYLKTYQELAAAAPQGQAAVERLRPMLEQLARIDDDEARRTAILEVAAAIARTGRIPEVLEFGDTRQGEPDRGRPNGRKNDPRWPRNGGSPGTRLPGKPAPDQDARLDKGEFDNLPDAS